MDRTVGVEEEFLVIDPESGEPVPHAESVVALAAAGEGGPELGGRVTTELKQEQAETNSKPWADMAELRTDLLDLRTDLQAIADSRGLRISPLGTTPFAVDSQTTRITRYEAMSDEFAIVAKEQLSCGCHVHVSVESREEGVGVIDRIRAWLPILTAISANSPFWRGSDTGYESYRSMVWGRWPTAGPTGTFGDVATYDKTLKALVDSEAILDDGMIYFDVRLSASFPTVEIRVADVCATADEAVLIAALCRGLVETAAADWRDGTAVPEARTELVRAAAWRAARSGLTGQLVHPVFFKPVGAATALEQLVAHVQPELEAYGDLDLVKQLLGSVFERGTGSRLQRADFAVRGRLGDVTVGAADRLLDQLDH